LQLKGITLSALLTAARGIGVSSPGAVASPPRESQAVPNAAELEQAVMEIFRELLRERYSITKMVPIHEVRAKIHSRYGEDAASHAVLDVTILNLWRGKQVRLISLEDAGAATLAQRQDSIPGVGETLFYLESGHDSSVV